jgi:putative heme-binding domain-containing protein
MLHTTRITALIILCVAITAVPASPQGDPKPALLKGVKAPAGFDVKLFAAPPDVTYPTCLAAAPTGELFIGIDENSSLDAKPGRGRIVKAIDTTGNGKADKFTVFAKVDSPRGLWYDNGVLYVLHPPYLSAFYEDPKTGTAARSEVLVKGIGFDLNFRGADHTTNGIRMGIDGWLYIAVGDYGFIKAVGKDGKDLQFRGGGVVRVRPDGTELEVVSRGQRNIYDVAIDPLMNLFTRDNTNDGGAWDVRLSHVVPGCHFGYPSLFMHFPEDILQPLYDYGPGAPTGALYMQEPGFPDGFGDTLYTCEWGRNAVYRNPLEPNGATFKVKQSPFVELPRPTDLDVDGLGRIYISSWRGGEYHFKNPDVGYVIRVTPPGHKDVPFPDLAGATDADLLKHLASPSHVCRIYTQREILRRGDKPAFAEGLEQITESGRTMQIRVAALFTLSQLRGPKSHPTLVNWTKNAELREFALRALADRKTQLEGVPAEPFLEALKDKSPRVRLAGVMGLTRLAKLETAPALLQRTTDTDPVITHIAVRGLIEMRAIDACLAALDGKAHALAPGAVAALQWIHDPRVADGLIQKLDQAKDATLRQTILKGLARLYHSEADWDGKWWSTRPDTSGPYFKPVTWSKSDDIGKTLRKAVAEADPVTLRVLAVEVRRNKLDVIDVTPSILKLAKDDPTFKATAVDLLVGTPKIAADAMRWLEDLASSDKEKSVDRAKAVRGLQRAVGNEGLSAAVRALASFGDLDKAAPELVKAWEDFARDTKHAGDAKKAGNAAYFAKLTDGDKAGQREIAFAVLLQISGQKGANATAKATATAAIDKGWKKPETAASLLRAIGQMQSTGYNSQVKILLRDSRAEVKDAATFAAKRLRLDANPSTATLKGMAYDKIVADVTKEKGDAKVGAQLFQLLRCTSCHTVSPTEPLNGPFLGGIRDRYSKAEIIESVLKPSAKIAQGFETVIFTLNNGRQLTGFIVRESGTEVEVRDGNGVVTVLAVKEIDTRAKSNISVMPEGLVDNLSVPEMAGLLAYLESLKGKDK